MKKLMTCLALVGCVMGLSLNGHASQIRKIEVPVMKLKFQNEEAPSYLVTPIDALVQLQKKNATTDIVGLVSAQVKLHLQKNDDTPIIGILRDAALEIDKPKIALEEPTQPLVSEVDAPVMKQQIEKNNAAPAVQKFLVSDTPVIPNNDGLKALVQIAYDTRFTDNSVDRTHPLQLSLYEGNGHFVIDSNCADHSENGDGTAVAYCWIKGIDTTTDLSDLNLYIQPQGDVVMQASYYGVVFYTESGEYLYDHFASVVDTRTEGDYCYSEQADHYNQMVDAFNSDVNQTSNECASFRTTLVVDVSDQ